MMTVLFVEAKSTAKRATRETERCHEAGSRSCCTTSLEVCAGPFDFSRLRISQQNFTFTVCPGGTNYLCAMLSISNVSHIFGRGSVRSSSRTLFIVD